MKENILFTIIMPIYNVAQFLPQAIQAVLDQTYHNYEIILVDDCATDSSPEICDQFAAANACITCIHFPKNQGVSAARNAGKDAAKGDYILFLDPDDIYEPTLLEKVAESLQQKRVDVVVYSLTEDYYTAAGRIDYSVEHYLPTMTLEDQQSIHQMVLELEKETMYGYPWNKAYSAQYLYESGAQFEKIHHIEDILFNIAFFQNITSMTILEDRLYHYRNQGQARLTSRYFPEYFDLQKQRIQAFIQQQDSWGTCTDRVLYIMAAVYFRSYLSFIQRELDHGRKRQEVIAMAMAEQSSDLFQQMRDYISQEGRMNKLVYCPLAEGNVKPAVRVSSIITWVRKWMPGLYARLKQKR